MKKRIMSVVLLLAIMLTTSAFAITPRYNETKKCVPRFSIHGTTADCGLDVSTVSRDADIVAFITLYKQNANGGYDELHGWMESGKGTLSFQDTYTSSKITSGTYRMEYSVRVRGDNGNDNISDYVEVKK